MQQFGALGFDIGLGIRQRGSGASDPSVGYALYLDFKNGLYRSGATKTADVTTLPGYTYTRSGAKSELLSTGAPTAFAANVPGIVPSIGYWSRQALTNLLLGAGTATTLGTQTTAALTTAPYTIYFEGTGSVALSGSFIGSLAGTGANNMVALVFTPTAAALTVTVTGSVTYAGLVLGSYPTGGPIIATTTATASIGADALSATVNPYTTDQDFLVWAVVDWRGAVRTTYDNYEAQFGTVNFILFRGNGSQIGLQGSSTYYLGSVNVTGRTVLAARRRAGKWTFAEKVGSTVTVYTEGGATTFPVATSSLTLGPSSDCAEEGIFAQTGTFSDAQITAILTAA